MNIELRNKIIESNKATRKLEDAGYSIQGCTNNFKQVAVAKNGEISTYDNYVDAANQLLS